MYGPITSIISLRDFFPAFIFLLVIINSCQDLFGIGCHSFGNTLLFPSVTHFSSAGTHLAIAAASGSP